MKRNGLKTVIITGATSGIGLGIARAFHESGYFVVLAARHRRDAFNSVGGNVLFVPCDVRKRLDVERLFAKAKKAAGRIDVVVNCAGVSGWKPIGKIDGPFLDQMLDVNLKGAFWGCQAAAKYLSREGVVINIASLAGKRGSANNSAYCAAKFGVVGLTQALAKELGPKGIRVNAVCPVYVMTPGVVTALKGKDSPAAGGDIGKYIKSFVDSQTALKRLPTSDEVGQVCVFLASDAASAVTGQSINIDCGVLPQ